MAEPKPRSMPAPIAACGALLVALAVAGLARGYDSTHRAVPVVVASRVLPPDGGPRDAGPSQVARLLDERPLDVNLASAEELQLLPRIGPTLAGRIIEERERGGPFRSVHDLARVRGIGPRTVERLMPLATVGETPDAGPSR